MNAVPKLRRHRVETEATSWTHRRPQTSAVASAIEQSSANKAIQADDQADLNQVHEQIGRRRVMRMEGHEQGRSGRPGISPRRCGQLHAQASAGGDSVEVVVQAELQ